MNYSIFCVPWQQLRLLCIFSSDWISNREISLVKQLQLCKIMCLEKIMWTSWLRKQDADPFKWMLAVADNNLMSPLCWCKKWAFVYPWLIWTLPAGHLLLPCCYLCAEAQPGLKVNMLFQDPIFMDITIDLLGLHICSWIFTTPVAVANSLKSSGSKAVDNISQK